MVKKNPFHIFIFVSLSINEIMQYVRSNVIVIDYSVHTLLINLQQTHLSSKITLYPRRKDRIKKKTYDRLNLHLVLILPLPILCQVRFSWKKLLRACCWMLVYRKILMFLLLQRYLILTLIYKTIIIIMLRPHQIKVKEIGFDYVLMGWQQSKQRR